MVQTRRRAAYRTPVPVEPGLTATVTFTVSSDDTAAAVGSGDVPVLATPKVVAICEQASVAALEGHLAEGETSVGSGMQISHVAPSGVGATVRAEATLDRVEGRRLTFTVAVTDARGLVAAGKVARVIVDRRRFLERLA
jgi:predicted thioesterase